MNSVQLASSNPSQALFEQEFPEAAPEANPSAFAEFIQKAVTPKGGEESDMEERPDSEELKSNLSPSSQDPVWSILQAVPPAPLPSAPEVLSPDLTASNSESTVQPTGASNAKAEPAPTNVAWATDVNESPVGENNLPQPKAEAPGPAPPTAAKEVVTAQPQLLAQAGLTQTDKNPAPEAKPPAGSPDGMATADSPSLVELTPKQDKNASAKEQNLPGENAPGEKLSPPILKVRLGDRVVSPAFAKLAEIARKPVRVVEHAPTISPSETLATPGTTVTGTVTGTEPTPGTAALGQVERLEKLGALVADCSVVLKETGNASLSIVIKPDAGTELTLHLRMRDGQVEVTAEMQRGDKAAFDSGWKQLQERLERQGIQLSALGTSLGSNSHPGGHQESRPQSSLLYSTDDLPANTGVKYKSPPTEQLRNARSLKGYEYWA
jgi:hypothetical protein